MVTNYLKQTENERTETRHTECGQKFLSSTENKMPGVGTVYFVSNERYLFARDDLFPFNDVVVKMHTGRP